MRAENLHFQFLLNDFLVGEEAALAAYWITASKTLLGRLRAVLAADLITGSLVGKERLTWQIRMWAATMCQMLFEIVKMQYLIKLAAGAAAPMRKCGGVLEQRRRWRWQLLVCRQIQKHLEQSQTIPGCWGAPT